MQITDILARNAKEWPNDVALVEINPQELEKRNTTWREYSLIESSPVEAFRSEITWAQFDEKANRFANFLLSRGLKKGDKVAILLMNCLEWLPIYFGVLRTGCLAVPTRSSTASTSRTPTCSCSAPSSSAAWSRSPTACRA